MALIELNLEKPALKRTEVTDSEDGEIGTADVGESDPKQTDSAIDESQEAETDGESTLGSRIRRTARRAAMVGAMTGAAVAARKIRARRKETGAQAEVDEDWQTVNN